MDWPKGISAITLFVEDLDATKAFYKEVFGLPVKFEDPDSAVFGFGNTLINLLKTSAAPELIEPAAVASPEAGARFQLPRPGRPYLGDRQIASGTLRPPLARRPVSHTPRSICLPPGN